MTILYFIFPFSSWFWKYFLYFQLVNFIVNNCDVISQWMLLWPIKERSLINYFKLFSKIKFFPNNYYFINSFIFSLYKHEERIKKLLSTEWKCLLNFVFYVGVSVWVWGMWYISIFTYSSKKHKLYGFIFIIQLCVLCSVYLCMYKWQIFYHFSLLVYVGLVYVSTCWILTLKIVVFPNLNLE